MSQLSRRGMLRATVGGLGALALGSNWAAAWVEKRIRSGEFADELVRTPSATEGPFYPTKLPLDTDNDLLIINDSITPAIGDITHLTGTILDARGNPLTNAVVEIWQVDGSGVYLHQGSNRREKLDKHFQGFGRFTTGSTGEYYFRTLRPVPYPGRTPHIHVKVKRGREELLTTQCYINGHPKNDRDGVLGEINNKRARDSVIVDFQPVKGSKTGELSARFDIVLGFTPPDDHAH